MRNYGSPKPHQYVQFLHASRHLNYQGDLHRNSVAHKWMDGLVTLFLVSTVDSGCLSVSLKVGHTWAGHLRSILYPNLMVLKVKCTLRKWEAQYVIQRGPISLTGGFFLSYSSYIYSAHVKSLSVKLAKIWEGLFVSEIFFENSSN